MTAGPTSGRRFGGAVAVGAGILLSRLSGLVRERALAHTLGTSPAADALRAALRIPNFLQNLLGEGVLSASFVPVYARLLAEGRVDDARRVARAVATLLALVTSAVALLGVVAAEPLVDVLAPGFAADTRALTIDLVRILFPGAALLVLSAWCLGVQSGHRRFFLSYAAPVVWNAAIIAAAVAGAHHVAGGDALAHWIAAGAMIGSGLQLAVQLPTVWGLLGGIRPVWAPRDPGLRACLANFGPVVLGRGSVQVSSYADQILASYLGAGLVAAIGYAQILFLLPISLFGMAISAAELPELASITGDRGAVAAGLRARLTGSLRRVTFLVVPSAVAFVAIGGSIVALVFQTGAFGARDTELVWLLLAGAAAGLVPSTWGRLLASAFYAIGEPRPPMYAALARLALGIGLGWALVMPIRQAVGYSAAWGGFGLVAASGAAAWLEFALLRRWLARRIDHVPLPWRLLLGTLALAAAAGAAGFGVSRALVDVAPQAVVALAACATFGVVYLAGAWLAGVAEARSLVRRRQRA